MIDCGGVRGCPPRRGGGGRRVAAATRGILPPFTHRSALSHKRTYEIASLSPPPQLNAWGVLAHEL